MEKEYTIFDRLFTQGPLTLNQFRKFLSILEHFEVGESDSFASVLTQLSADRVNEVMGIVLEGDHDKIDWNEAPFDLIDEVVTDFLSLNPRLKLRLSELLSTLISTVMTKPTT